MGKIILDISMRDKETSSDESEEESSEEASDGNSQVSADKGPKMIGDFGIKKQQQNVLNPNIHH
jgi:hypothetical protein